MKKQINKRRTFTVREQLVGKLGPSGYGALLDRLERSAAKPKRRRRPRKAVA